MSSVCFLAPWYDQRAILVESLLAQTCRDWSLLLTYDGPTLSPASRLPWFDKRIEVFTRKDRANDYGHTLRAEMLEIVKERQHPCEFVVVTNADNYYVPGFVEQMLHVSYQFPEAAAYYCDIVHSHVNWQYFPCGLSCSRIDCGCVMARAKLATAVGWRDKGYAGDWTWIDDMIKHDQKQLPQPVPVEQRFIHHPHPLFIHN